MRRLPLLTAPGVFLLTLLCPACGSKGPALYPVRGQVLFNDKPAAGALVVFHPANTDDAAAPRPSGQVKEDGSFTLQTHPHGEGAPPGEYKVAIVWIDEKAQANPTTGEVPNRLHARYATPQTTPLQARVEEGQTEVPVFRLTK